MKTPRSVLRHLPLPGIRTSPLFGFFDFTHARKPDWAGAS
jgi:hypothetical protein